MSVRLAKSGDIPAILKVERDAKSAAHWAPHEYERLIEFGLLLVRAEGNCLHGFIAAQEIAGEWHLQNIVVSEPFRRRGVADALLSALLKHAEEQAGQAVLLEVRESNAAARSLYGKHGFQLVGGRPRYYKDPEEDALLYTFHLRKDSADLA